MELETWSEDWGLPSVEPECLKALAYAKFCGAPITQKQTDNPFWSSSGNLPVFSHASSTTNTKLTDFSAIVKHLAICNYSTDHNLTAKQRAETDAFINLIKEKLSPALQYVFWIDTKNHIEFSRQWYCKHLPFPMGYYYPGRYHQQAVRLIESLYSQYTEFGEIGNDTIVETSVYKSAQECLTLLDNRLGDSPYMFGRSPGRLDAVMYGYLAPLLKAPLPNNALQNYLKGCSNLVRFVVKVSQNYFPQTVKAWDDKNNMEEEKRQKKNNESKKKKEKQPDSEEDLTWPNETRNKVIAGAVASTAMLGYAYHSGLYDIVRNIEIRIVGDDEDEDYVDDDIED
eukprot:TRINITY_DN19127_c0_g1_i3.p1 TRINITY_DN19127_c0_g1~~TRINITY_DN19127_c0_g1_i3.p1  ORF type:complete len:341 (-),score=55.41 TRINITY_DN19127_c0_g1_i3:207-1229(-)